MRARIGLVATGVVMALASLPAAADDLSGAQHLLCSIRQATVCTADGTCDKTPPWQLDIPDFIEVDLQANLLKTTDASAENRRTSILSLSRQNGLIVIQGLENQRAFSLNIDEPTGTLIVAVARPFLFVGASGACTPMTASK